MPGDADSGIWGLLPTSGAPELGFVKTFPPAPVTSTPVQPVVPQPLPVPPKRVARRHKRGYVRGKFVIGWTWDYARTRLAQIHVTGLPRNARIEVRCRGRGCPDAVVAAGFRGRGGLLRSLDGRVFRAGDVITIIVTAPGRRPERIGVRIRNGKEPLARLL